jgi:hypothetical protein
LVEFYLLFTSCFWIGVCRFVALNLLFNLIYNTVTAPHKQPIKNSKIQEFLNACHFPPFYNSKLNQSPISCASAYSPYSPLSNDIQHLNNTSEKNQQKTPKTHKIFKTPAIFPIFSFQI